jgi:hypothetical protein
VLTQHAPDAPVPGVTFAGHRGIGVEVAKVAMGDLRIGEGPRMTVMWLTVFQWAGARRA